MIKLWSNDKWVCPECGQHARPKQQHGVDDCLVILKKKNMILDKCHEDACRRCDALEKQVESLTDEVYKARTRAKALAEALAFANFKEEELG